MIPELDYNRYCHVRIPGHQDWIVYFDLEVEEAAGNKMAALSSDMVDGKLQFAMFRKDGTEIWQNAIYAPTETA